MRLIDADELRDEVLHDTTHPNEIVNYYLDAIDYAPTIDAVPVVRGEWVAFDPLNTERPYNWTCSSCGGGCVDYRTAYCPDCGAKMEAQNE